MDMSKMMDTIKEVQEKMKRAQENLVNIKVESEAGAGMVKIRINGKKQLEDIQIDDSIMDDKEMVQDLLIAAVNKGIEEVEIKSKEELKNSTSGFLPNIPGMDLNQFM